MDGMSDERISASRVIPAPADRVLAVLRDPVLIVDADDVIHPLNPPGEQVAAVLFGGTPPREALEALMARDAKPEVS